MADRLETKEWEIHTDPEMEVKGFKIGDRVQWHGIGPTGTVERFSRLTGDRCYVDLKMDDGSYNRWGVDFVKRAEVIGWLAKIGEDDA